MVLKQKLLLISLERADIIKIYKKTVDPPLTKKIIRKFVLPTKILNSDVISIWGLNETKENHRIWESIKTSDIILFLKDGKYFSRGQISHKIKDDLLSRITKNLDLVKSRKLLLFIKELEQTDIDFESTIPIFIDPVMKNSYRFPIKIVDEKKTKLLVKTFGSIEKALEFMENSKDEYNTLSEYIDKKNLKHKTKFTRKVGKVKQRVGQTVFSKQVLKNFNNKCAVCSISQPELLEAGHIIPVDDERVAGMLENGICFCKTCHKLFDSGYFSFDDNYRIVFSKQKKFDGLLRHLIFEKKRIGKCLREPSKSHLLYHRIKFNIF